MSKFASCNDRAAKQALSASALKEFCLFTLKIIKHIVVQFIAALVYQRPPYESVGPHTSG